MHIDLCRYKAGGRVMNENKISGQQNVKNHNP